MLNVIVIAPVRPRSLIMYVYQDNEYESDTLLSAKEAISLWILGTRKVCVLGANFCTKLGVERGREEPA